MSYSQPPRDPVMLLSYINTQLRDYYTSFDELAAALQLDREGTIAKLRSIDYEYSPDKNQFV